MLLFKKKGHLLWLYFVNKSSIFLYWKWVFVFLEMNWAMLLFYFGKLTWFWSKQCQLPCRVHSCHHCSSDLQVNSSNLQQRAHSHVRAGTGSVHEKLRVAVPMWGGTEGFPALNYQTNGLTLVCVLSRHTQPPPAAPGHKRRLHRSVQAQPASHPTGDYN